MSTQEKAALKSETFAEAIRYLVNAKDTLKKAGKQGKFYEDAKYVRSASGIAYSGMMLALDTMMKLNNVTPPRGNRKSIDWYRLNLGKMDWKHLNEVNTAYNALHILGYYEGELSMTIIQDGMEKVKSVISRLKASV